MEAIMKVYPVGEILYGKDALVETIAGFLSRVHERDPLRWGRE
jgi:hypothetical protein